MTFLPDLYIAYKKEIDTHHYRQASNIKKKPNRQHRQSLRENRLKLMRKIYPRGKTVLKMMRLT